MIGPDYLSATEYNIKRFIEGHTQTIGKHAGIVKNPMWEIEKDGKPTYIMYCEPETLCILCPEGYQKIVEHENNMNDGRKLTWYKSANGYISTKTKNGGLSMHQIIMNCYGNGKGTGVISVDHINRNRIDNRVDNLRIATRKEQEQNTVGIMPGTKKQRQHGAQALPEGITQDMMRKYVIYYKEWLNRDRTKYRDYFRVEHHPNLHPNQWETTKSGNVSIQDKLAQANKVVDDLDRGILPVKEARGLPKSIYISNFRNKPHLVFDFRDATNRYNLKMVLPENYNLDTELDRLQEKIKAKYDIDIDMTPE